jgi:AcrR family transcriptional regulator
MLRDALIQSILERGWDEVSVQEVCARADVGRSTFYVHFADKEDLLLSGFGDLRQTLRERATARGHGPLGFTLALLEHARENHRLFRALLGKRTAQVVHRAFVDVVTDLLEEDVADTMPAGPLRDAAVRYVAGAFWELLQWWGDQPSSTAIEVDEMFRRLTTPVVAEMKRWGAEAPTRSRAPNGA